MPDGRSWHHMVFHFSPDEFPSLDCFLADFHANHPADSMNQLMRTLNGLLTKLKHLQAAYQFLGFGPEFVQFKEILDSLWRMRDQVVLWRMIGAGLLAIISGQRPPCIADTTARDAVKFYDYVKWYAMSLGYRIGGPDDNVYVQTVCKSEGVEHVTPHWGHVTRRPQPGDGPHFICL